MELSVTQENLSKALSNVGRVASSKAGLPILSNILLRTDGNRLLVAATNLEIASTHYVGAKIVTPGAITIPARLVSDFVSSLLKIGHIDAVLHRRCFVDSRELRELVGNDTVNDRPIAVR